MKKILLLSIVFLLTACATKVKEDINIEYEVYERENDNPLSKDKDTIILQTIDNELANITLVNYFYFSDYIVMKEVDLDSLDKHSYEKEVKPVFEKTFFNVYKHFENLVYKNVEVQKEGSQFNDIKYIVLRTEVIQTVKPHSKLIIRNKKAETEKNSDDDIYHNSPDSLGSIRESLKELEYEKEDNQKRTDTD